MIGKLAGDQRVAATAGRGRGPRGQPTTLQPLASRCPIPGCGEQIDPTRLMCRRDWYLVPRELRDQVWATWRSGQGAFTREHRAAVRRAISAARQRRSENLPASSARSTT